MSEELLELGGGTPQWRGMDGAVAWHLIERQADDWADIGRMMQAWLEANRAPVAPVAPDVAAKALAFVLRHGVPMERRGRYRYHGVTPPVWHATPEAAIEAAMGDAKWLAEVSVCQALPVAE